MMNTKTTTTAAPPVKKIMYLQRRAPYGTNYAHEGLDLALVGAAFGQQVCIAFVDDGVFQLRRGQDTQAAGCKNFTAAFGALADYEITAVVVERESLTARGLSDDDLMVVPGDGGGEKSLLRIVSAEELAKIIAAQDVLLNF